MDNKALAAWSCEEENCCADRVTAAQENESKKQVEMIFMMTKQIDEIKNL
ncbi:MAG: hypothetical protein ACRENG_23380 [bacterium]